MPKNIPVHVCCKCTRRLNLVTRDGKEYCKFHDEERNKPVPVMFPAFDLDALDAEIRNATRVATVHGPQEIIQYVGGEFQGRSCDPNRTTSLGLGRRIAVMVQTNGEATISADCEERVAYYKDPHTGRAVRDDSAALGIVMTAGLLGAMAR